MNYYIQYFSTKDLRQYYGLRANNFGEVVVIDNIALYTLKAYSYKCRSNELIRGYVIDRLNAELTQNDLLCRYKRKRKGRTKMRRSEEKNMVDEIREEMTSYSDDSLFNITSFGTDMSFRELITMYEEGDLEKPEMQRNYVWGKNEASRFIDSILLGLPVPSIFLAKTEDEKRLIVDGYQRIMTVYDYVKRGIFGGDGKSFALSNSENINERWRGKTFQELQPDEQRKIRNSPIHAIVFEQKEPKDDTGMYQIFERINTSGRTLKPQEIRNCVYHGEFNKLLLELNKDMYWRAIYDDAKQDTRMSDIELILRMFAFAYLKSQKEASLNQINLVKYLNQFMKRNSSLETIGKDELTSEFTEIMKFLFDNFGKRIFRNGKLEGEKVTYVKKINPAILDSIYSSTQFARTKKDLNLINTDLLLNRYDKLILNKTYQDAISKRTTNIDKIRIRIELATEILYGVKYEW